MDLKGKVALITGGGTRLGRVITLALANSGCHVFIHYGRSEASARQTEKDARALGVDAKIYCADLADDNAVQAVVPAARKHFKSLDILVNNAAIFPENDAFPQTDTALWERLFTVNLRAPFMLSRAFVAQIPAKGRGEIINVTDSRVRRPGTDHFVYRLTKGGLWQMTEMLAIELAPRVCVNGLALGAILPPTGKGEGYLKKIAREKIPLKQHGSEEAVSEGVLYLLHQDFLTGVVLPIDGGEFL
ncbi:MAG: SDR family oxidoreductase [Deltaproteobacteria bacterium]|nr:SDR family oxidoreductase [Deltaproteobacteria bacterium]